MRRIAFNWFREHCKWRSAVWAGEQAVCTHRNHNLTYGCSERVCPVLHAPEADYCPDEEPIETLPSVRSRSDCNHETMFRLERCATCGGTGRAAPDRAMIDTYDSAHLPLFVKCPDCGERPLPGYKLVSC